MEREGTGTTAGYVTRRDLELLLSQVEGCTADPREGIFGSDSITWRVNRESALFLGAGRAALLQLAHPWVATALKQHSSLLQNPIVRFHNTFRVVFTMIFGSIAQALNASRSLHQLHTRIRGQLGTQAGSYTQGSHYEANHIPALRWVFATLVESAVLAYEWVFPFDESDRAAYYEESKVLASLFGIPTDALPRDWNAFAQYVSAMCDSAELGVDATAGSMANDLLAGAGSWIRPPRWYRALTASWMPSRFREEFHLSFGAEESEAVERAHRWLPVAYRRLPETVRCTGAYLEARARLARRKPGLLARSSNRFWIGQPQLPFAD
jgi:uncharacterized protein (DUF2236 family)